MQPSPAAVEQGLAGVPQGAVPSQPIGEGDQRGLSLLVEHLAVIGADQRQVPVGGPLPPVVDRIGLAVDDMKLVRGTNVYPRAVEAIVREHPEIDEFQIHLFTEEGIRDEIEVLCEIPGPDADAEALLSALQRELADAHEGLRFGVRRAEDGSLPRFELKARRLLDERTVIGTEGERRQA